MNRTHQAEPEDSLSDALRKALRNCGLTTYEVAKRSGVSAILISRFVRGERDIRLATADKLARVLDCRMV